MNATSVNPETLLSDIWSEHRKDVNDGIKQLNDHFNKKIENDQKKIAQIQSDIENQKINPLKGRLAIDMLEKNIELVQGCLPGIGRMMTVTNAISPHMELIFAITDKGTN